jgi:hypothetical protein
VRAWRTLACLISVPALGCSDAGQDDDSSPDSSGARDGTPPATTTSAGTVTVEPTPTAPEQRGPAAVDEPSADAGPEEERRELAWAPPALSGEYETVTLPRDGGRVRLDSDTDYRLTSDRPIEGPLEIIGGRDVVWIGGAIVIERPRPLAEPHRAIGLTIRDGDDSHERTVHLEGLFLGGDGLNDGINVDAPSAVVQVQNVHIAGVVFDGADDRDGTGAYDGMGRNHPDVLQVYGGHRELRVDGLSATSAYQGLFLKVDHPDGRGGTVRLRNVDVRAVEITGVDGVEYAGNRMYFWDAATIGDQYIENGTVWIRHHPDAGKVADAPNDRPDSGGWWRGAYRDGPDGDLVVEPPPGVAGPADAAERLSSGEPVIEPRLGADRDGFYLWWPPDEAPDRSVVRDASGDGPGRIHLGVPAGGPYVPASTVGPDYRSPGYGGGAR